LWLLTTINFKAVAFKPKYNCREGLISHGFFYGEIKMIIELALAAYFGSYFIEDEEQYEEVEPECSDQ
jgi:hypothetical protein